jgi:hypothetical protein
MIQPSYNHATKPVTEQQQKQRITHSVRFLLFLLETAACLYVTAQKFVMHPDMEVGRVTAIQQAQNSFEKYVPNKAKRNTVT